MHYAGAFTLWIAPVQVEICPVSEKVPTTRSTSPSTLKRHNIRVHLDDRNEKLPAKIRDAQMQKIPYIAGGRRSKKPKPEYRNSPPAKAISAPSPSPK